MCPNYGMLINILPALSKLVCNIGLCSDNECGVFFIHRCIDVGISGMELDVCNVTSIMFV